MTAFLIVRAEVGAPQDREPFDTWYRDEHLPDAVRAFGARGAWRGWSDVEDRVHYAFYGFEDLAAARAVSDSPEIRELIAEFDRKWGTRVTRTRDIVEHRQGI